MLNKEIMSQFVQTVRPRAREMNRFSWCPGMIFEIKGSGESPRDIYLRNAIVEGLAVLNSADTTPENQPVARGHGVKSRSRSGTFFFSLCDQHYLYPPDRLKDPSICIAKISYTFIENQ